MTRAHDAQTPVHDAQTPGRPAPRPEPLLLSLAEAAALLGISRTLCWELCRQQQLPNVRLGRKRLLIPRAALQSFVDEQTRTAIANTAIAKDAADPMSPRPLAS